MKHTESLSKIAFLGSYIPRKCGIATFTHDLRQAVAGVLPHGECEVIAVNDQSRGYDYKNEVCFEIGERRTEDYRQAADYLRLNGFEVLCLQHEFGIFGGKEGSHLLTLLREVGIPVVTTLHTILESPNPDQRRVFDEVVKYSARLVVMSERGQQILRNIYEVPEEQVDLIPHGIPDVPFTDPSFFKDEFGVEGKRVLLTFGLLSPGKGIQHVIRALPDIVKANPDLVYIVLGATHPHLVRHEGEAYRLSLQRLSRDLGVEKHVAFYDRFVDLEELKAFIGAADVYITPYLNPAQITSGTLSYAFGCGKAVISTPYWHAQELLADDRGILVPFEDSGAIAREVNDLLGDNVRLNALRKRAYLAGRPTIWSATGNLYLESFRAARERSKSRPMRRYAVKTLNREQWKTLPKLNLAHLRRMTDSTGVVQHATFSFPNYEEGYCLDDNARAFLLTVLLEDSPKDLKSLRELASTYAAFINYAFNRETKRFRNFMSYDRRWLESQGSDDSHARTLWILGTAVGRSQHQSFRNWAAGLFAEALPPILEIQSPRSWAFALLGIGAYMHEFEGDRHVSEIRGILTRRLVDLFKKQSSEDWPWFEPVLSYVNPKLPHALIASARDNGDDEALELGLQTLRWISRKQTSPEGWFRPIGSDWAYEKGGERPDFDQQPIEAHAMVSASIAAYDATRNPLWITEAHKAFDWFLGRNDLEQSLYNPSSGGCYDGLHFDRVNLNQGAESLLAFLLSLVELRHLDAALVSFEPHEEEGSAEEQVMAKQPG